MCNVIDTVHMGSLKHILNVCEYSFKSYAWRQYKVL